MKSARLFKVLITGGVAGDRTVYPGARRPQGASRCSAPSGFGLEAACAPGDVGDCRRPAHVRVSREVTERRSLDLSLLMSDPQRDTRTTPQLLRRPKLG